MTERANSKFAAIEVATCTPRMHSRSSVWPLPSTPAMPTISPRRASRHTSSRMARLPSRNVRLDTTSAFSSRTVDAPVVGLGNSLPTISSANWRAVTVDGSCTSATVLPWRMTVMASATDSTSSSLWEMKMTVDPLATSSRREANSSSTSWGTSTAVGSSRMMIRAPRYSTLRISTR